MTTQARKQIEAWSATSERYICKVAARVTPDSFGRAAIVWAAQMKLVEISGHFATDYCYVDSLFEWICKRFHERQTTPAKASDESKTQTNTTAA